MSATPRLGDVARRWRMAPAMNQSSGASEAQRATGAAGDRLEAALSMARDGLAVLPLHTPLAGGCSCRKRQDCTAAGKHPRTSHGLNDASRDEETIRGMWEQWPDANVGARTGNGVIVLDIDADKNGFESLQALSAEIGPLPQTRTAKTGGGGEHRYFSAPAGIEIRNSAGRLGDGLDVRGDGGYVVAPPSLHVSGSHYEWTGDIAAVAQLPEAWIDVLLGHPVPSTVVSSGEASASATSSHETGALADLVDAVRRAKEGKRNETLNRYAFDAGRLIRGRYVDEDATRSALLAAAIDTKLPREEIEATLDSALAAGKLATLVPALAGKKMLTDLGNAERLVARHGASFRYVAAFGQFFVWDGSRFRRGAYPAARDEHCALDLRRGCDRHRLIRANQGRQPRREQ